jgi:hypothetical protein
LHTLHFLQHPYVDRCHSLFIDENIWNFAFKRNDLINLGLLIPVKILAYLKTNVLLCTFRNTCYSGITSQTKSSVITSRGERGPVLSQTWQQTESYTQVRGQWSFWPFLGMEHRDWTVLDDKPMRCPSLSTSTRSALLVGGAESHWKPYHSRQSCSASKGNTNCLWKCSCLQIPGQCRQYWIWTQKGCVGVMHMTSAADQSDS